MKIKKYKAASMDAALKTIRAELGDEAVILHSKEVDTGGFLGFFTKKQLEVTVAIDKDKRQPYHNSNKPSTRNNRPTVNKKVRNTPLQLQRNDNDLIEEINELKRLVESMTKEKSKPKYDEYPEPFQQIDDHLRAHGVIYSIRLKIMKQLLQKWYEATNEENKHEVVKNELERIVHNLLARIPIGSPTFTKKIITVVGPTGVGKTTTIAKIAADCVLNKQKKVALITTDTYRIAAVEQLKTYAKILNIPLEVAYSIDDFQRSIEQFSHYDLIIVDSAGRNFRNQLYVEELKKVIDFQNDVETFLVLSLTSKYEDMKEIVNQFSIVPIEKVILTKLDETRSHGALMNIPVDLGKGIAYVTNGQNVPDDIIDATIPFIEQCVIAGAIE